MRRDMVLHVAYKEILSTLRDRRAIISNLLIPFFVLPVVMLGLPLLFGGLFEREAETVSQVAARGISYLPAELIDMMERENVELVEVDDPFSEVEQDAYRAGIEVEERFQEQIQAGEQAPLTLISKSGNLRSDVTTSKVRSAVDAYRQTLVAQRLREAGLDPGMLEPILLERTDASTPAERASGMLGWLIPFFIVIWTLTGGQMTAIDATAGEKERGTLEVLLVSPIRRSEVVLGKFFATAIFGLSAACMAILGYVVGGVVARSAAGDRLGVGGQEIAEMMGGSLNISGGPIALLIITSLLVAALIASLLICITMFARSYKEAQSYVAPLSLVMILPLVALQFSDFLDVSAAIYLIPFVNTMFLLDSIISGGADIVHIVFTWGSTLLYCGLLLGFAYRNFRQEHVLFRN